MLKTYLKFEMNSDPTNMTLTHQVIMDTYKKGRGVENNIGIYNRVKKMNQHLVEEIKTLNEKGAF